MFSNIQFLEFPSARAARRPDARVGQLRNLLGMFAVSNPFRQSRFKVISSRPLGGFRQPVSESQFAPELGGAALLLLVCCAEIFRLRRSGAHAVP